jgi:hypothetical protein
MSDTIQRYLVFSGAHYYPAGGWFDFNESFDTMEAALAYARAQVDDSYTWAYVLDLETREWVEVYKEGNETEGT